MTQIIEIKIQASDLSPLCEAKEEAVRESVRKAAEKLFKKPVKVILTKREKK